MWKDLKLLKDNLNCEYELEEVFKKEKYIPNVHQSQTTFNGVYILRQFYSHGVVQ